eukprot:1191048-Prorocentrum_minimum.AAC.4
MATSSTLSSSSDEDDEVVTTSKVPDEDVYFEEPNAGDDDALSRDDIQSACTPEATARVSLHSCPALHLDRCHRTQPSSSYQL